jgi:RNA polymerase sigma factor (TIGR02999 family)
MAMKDSSYPASRITESLRDWSGQTDMDYPDGLLQLVYSELHRQAHRYLQRERIGHTLQTTALVNEAYLKLLEQKNVAWKNRAHFFAIAATLMRRILIDYAKNKQCAKRGGVSDDSPIDEATIVTVSGGPNYNLIALNEALDKLAAKDQNMVKVVELRFFSGLDVSETAEVLGVSESTVKRDWSIAKAWLHRELTR